MRLAVFFILSFLAFYFPSKAQATSCSSLSTVNILDFVAQNDVIFIGRKSTEPVDSERQEFRVNDSRHPRGFRIISGWNATRFEVVEPLKGVPDGTDNFVIYGTRGMSGENGTKSFSIYKKDEYLVFAYYDGNPELIAPNYDCVSTPRADLVISFLKGPYRYWYLILGFILFALLSVWWAGGLNNLISAPLVKTRNESKTPTIFKWQLPSRLRICVLVFLSSVAVLVFFNYILVYNFYPCRSFLGAIVGQLSFNLLSCLAPFPR